MTTRRNFKFTGLFLTNSVPNVASDLWCTLKPEFDNDALEGVSYLVLIGFRGRHGSLLSINSGSRCKLPFLSDHFNNLYKPGIFYWNLLLGIKQTHFTYFIVMDKDLRFLVYFIFTFLYKMILMILTALSNWHGNWHKAWPRWVLTSC